MVFRSRMSSDFGQHHTESRPQSYESQVGLYAPPEEASRTSAELSPGKRGHLVSSKDTSLRPLFIFEMANNHMGSVEHGLRIVRAMREVSKDFPFNFGIKLQYRDIDTFIHPDYQQPASISSS